MNSDSLSMLLDSLQYGAYAVSLDQRIMYWNRSAERILGLQSREVVGRRCYDVLQGTTSGSLTPECVGGCPSIRYLRAGLVPATTKLRMLTASGERKWIHVTPMVIGGAFRDAPIVVHLFDDGEEAEGLDRAKDTFRDSLTGSGKEVLSFPPPPAIEAGEGSDLSRRELEVLRLVALGWETPRIATDLGISRHTVRNHIRNLRHKLNAPTKLDAVVKGIRMGILPMGRQ